jgi:transposase-like protein
MSKRGRKNRRTFTAEQKATMLRRHFVDKVAVSDLCDEYKIQPSLFYLWQRQALENREKAISAPEDRDGARRQAEQERKIAVLEAKVARKDSIIAEISEESVTLKKTLGEP